jgi:hypothetical protein
MAPPNETETPPEGTVIEPVTPTSSHEQTSEFTTIPVPEAAVLNMETSAVEELSFMGYDLNEHGLFASEVEDFLKQFKVIDLLDLVDLSREPYGDLAKTIKDDGFPRMLPFLVDLKLFVSYLYNNTDFEDIMRQHDHNVREMWSKIMEDEKWHKRRYQRYKDMH